MKEERKGKPANQLYIKKTTYILKTLQRPHELIKPKHNNNNTNKYFKKIKITRSEGYTVALEGLIVLEDATFVNQALLIGGDVAAASDDLLEGPDDGIQPNRNRKLGTVGAPNVDVHSSSVGGGGGLGLLNGTVTSHGVPTSQASTGGLFRNRVPERETESGSNRRSGRGNRNPNPRLID